MYSKKVLPRVCIIIGGPYLPPIIAGTKTLRKNRPVPKHITHGDVDVDVVDVVDVDVVDDDVVDVDIVDDVKLDDTK